jgi:hypothetical protein
MAAAGACSLIRALVVVGIAPLRPSRDNSEDEQKETKATKEEQPANPVSNRGRRVAERLRAAEMDATRFRLVSAITSFPFVISPGELLAEASLALCLT